MVRAGCAVKVELSEGADRLAVAVRGRGVGALREVTANIPEGSYILHYSQWHAGKPIWDV